MLRIYKILFIFVFFLGSRISSMACPPDITSRFVDLEPPKVTQRTFKTAQRTVAVRYHQEPVHAPLGCNGNTCLPAAVWYLAERYPLNKRQSLGDLIHLALQKKLIPTLEQYRSKEFLMTSDYFSKLRALFRLAGFPEIAIHELFKHDISGRRSAIKELLRKVNRTHPLLLAFQTSTIHVDGVKWLLPYQSLDSGGHAMIWERTYQDTEGQLWLQIVEPDLGTRVDVRLNDIIDDNSIIVIEPKSINPSIILP